MSVFFRGRERSKKREAPKIEDVFFDNARKVIDLRKELPLIQFNFKVIPEYLKRNYTPIGIIIGLTVVIGFLSSAIVGRALVTYLYPGNCLGTWQHAENAQGEPSLPKDAPLEHFNETNSALIKNGIGTIYCGGFKGEIPEDTVPSKILVSFSWSIDTGEVEHIEKDPLLSLPDAVSENQDSKEESQVETKSEDKTESGETPNENSPTPTTDKVSPDEETTTGTTGEVLESPETTPEEIPPAEEAGSTGAFLFPLVQTAHAEETGAEAPPEEALPPIEIIEVTDPIQEPEPVKEPQEETPEIVTQPEVPPTVPENSPDNTTEELSPEAETLGEELPPQEEAPAPEVPHANEIALIRYTLDGTTWNDLGGVNIANWSDASFEIPITEITSWENLQNLQVSVEVPLRFDISPIIYLDTVSLEIEYLESTQIEVFNVIPQVYSVSELTNTSSDFTVSHQGGLETPERLLVTSAQAEMGGIVVYNSTSGERLLTTWNPEFDYSLDLSYLGEGSFIIIQTSDLDSCASRTLEECRDAPDALAYSTFSIVKNEDVDEVSEDSSSEPVIDAVDEESNSTEEPVVPKEEASEDTDPAGQLPQIEDISEILGAPLLPDDSSEEVPPDETKDDSTAE